MLTSIHVEAFDKTEMIKKTKKQISSAEIQHQPDSEDRSVQLWQVFDRTENQRLQFKPLKASFFLLQTGISISDFNLKKQRDPEQSCVLPLTVSEF